MQLPLLIVTLSSLLTIKLARAASRGDSCVDTRELNGFCKYIFECHYVMQVKMRQGPYTRCGFENGVEVVCCGERVQIQSRLLIDDTKRYVRECEKYKSDMFDNSQSKLSCNQYVFPLVVSGENASPKEFPHMALVGCLNDDGKTTWICGGTLISPNFILTAAHCIEDQDVCEDITDVLLGELVLDTETDDAQPRNYKVETTTVHPNYTRSGDTKETKYNDIALVKLTTNVEMNEYRRPACLPYQNSTDISQLIITGWGANETAARTVKHLQKATIQSFDPNICDDIYNEDKDSPHAAEGFGRLQICGGSNYTGQDTCQGDSGGPLQSVHPVHPCMYTVLGVTSGGEGCGTAQIPAVYARVFAYIDWIEKIVWG